LVGRTIARAAMTRDSYFFLTKPATLARRLRGRRVDALTRRGKYLIAELDDHTRLLLHLGMTGQLFAANASSPRLLRATARGILAPEMQNGRFTPDAHTHLRLHFDDDGPEVYFRDTRKFGKVQLLNEGQPSDRLDKLGTDALIATGVDLYEAARSRRAPIKTVLLDQEVLAGVGNIYADEALYLAGVRPTRPASALTPKDCNRVVAMVQRVMQRSIETGGSSISDYVRPDGSDGGYQDERHVYAREGEPCKRCKTKIERVVLGQRSTCYCPHCQK
jgi:formamidopyrimidine-DNA glycosylase